MSEELARVLSSRPRHQCQSAFTVVRGRQLSSVFCTEDAGHEGLHKGFRKQWDDSGKLVKKTRER